MPVIIFVICLLALLLPLKTTNNYLNLKLLKGMSQITIIKKNIIDELSLKCTEIREYKLNY